MEAQAELEEMVSEKKMLDSIAWTLRLGQHKVRGDRIPTLYKEQVDAEMLRLGLISEDYALTERGREYRQRLIDEGYFRHPEELEK